MKKLIVIFIFIFGLNLFVSAGSLDDAINRMYENGLTKFDNQKDFMSTNNLRRDEASKFFVQYAKKILSISVDKTDIQCSFFSDLNKGRPDLKDTMKESCNLGMFKGSNGKFMPTDNLTNGQAITVLIRLIDGQKDETQGHFAQKYYDKAKELGILDGILISENNFDKLISRGTIARLIFNASTLKKEVINLSISGSGSQTTNKFHLTKGLITFKSTYIGESNFIVDLLDSEGNTLDLIANVIGSTSTSKSVKIDEDGMYVMNVTAWTDSNRTININN